MVLTASSTTLAAGSPLADLQWQARLVVVTAADPSDPQLLAQRERRQGDLAGWRERAIRLVEVTGEEVRVDGQPSDLSAARLRTVFGLPADRFMAALVGLDGGVKARRHDAFSNPGLYAAIDAMPMRRQELDRRHER